MIGWRTKAHGLVVGLRDKGIPTDSLLLHAFIVGVWQERFKK